LRRCLRSTWGQGFGASPRCWVLPKWPYTRLHTQWQSVGSYGQATVLAERGVYGGMYEKMDRVTVAEAAIRLGVKEQAIRKRIQRGTLAHDKDEDGRVHVYLDREAGATATGSDTGMATLLQSLQEQIAYLRQESEDWKEEARRKDTIIMSLTQRIPELQAPTEPREVFESATQAKGKGVAYREDQVLSQGRLWLHRFFFGP
jgi:hypothetical protein